MLLHQTNSVASWIRSGLRHAEPTGRQTGKADLYAIDSNKEGVTRLQQDHGVSNDIKMALDRVSMRSIRRGRKPAQDSCVLREWHPAFCKHFDKSQKASQALNAVQTRTCR